MQFIENSLLYLIEKDTNLFQKIIKIFPKKIIENFFSNYGNHLINFSISKQRKDILDTCKENCYLPHKEFVSNEIFEHWLTGINQNNYKERVTFCFDNNLFGKNKFIELLACSSHKKSAPQILTFFLSNFYDPQLINKPTLNGNTLLHNLFSNSFPYLYADLTEGKIDFWEQLYNYDLDFSIQNKDGDTPIHLLVKTMNHGLFYFTTYNPFNQNALSSTSYKIPIDNDFRLDFLLSHKNFNKNHLLIKNNDGDTILNLSDKCNNESSPIFKSHFQKYGLNLLFEPTKHKQSKLKI